MGWLRTLSSAFATKAQNTFERSLSLVSLFLTNALWLIAADFPTLARSAFGKNAVTYACLRLLSQSVPEPPLLAYTEDAEGEVTPLPREHPLNALIRRPNELMTEFEFWELTELHIGITGAAYWWKQRTNGNQIAALWPLRPDRVTPIYSGTLNVEGERLLWGWAYHPPGGDTPKPIPRSEVMVFGQPDPAGESGGIVEALGPAQVLSSEISADNQATSFVGALLTNYAQPSMLIKTKAAIKDKEIALRLKQQFMTELGGAHRGEPALLDADTTIEKLSFDLQQLEFPDLRSVAESRIAAAFGVPALLVGLKVGIEHSTYNNMDGWREFFVDTTLSSKWRRYSDQFTNDIAAEFGENIVCRFDTTKVKALAGQRAKAIEPIRDGFERGAVTLAVYVEKLGVALPDGVDGDVYYVPNTVTVVPAADLGKPKPEPPAPIIQTLPHPPQGQLPPVQPDQPVDDPQKAIKSTDAGSVERRANRTRQKHVVAFERQVMEVLADQRNHVVQAWHETAKAAPNADDLMRGDDDERLGKIVRERWEMVLTDSYTDAAATLGDFGLSFELPNEWVQTVLDEVATRVVGISDTTRAAITHTISQAASEGLSITDIAERLKQSAAFSDSRAEMIARTETAMAYSTASLKAYEESGLVENIEVLDGDYDTACAGLNGSTHTIAWARANLIQHPRCTRAFAPLIAS